MLDKLNMMRSNPQTYTRSFMQFFFQRPLVELAEVYSRRHLPESDVTRDNVKAFCYSPLFPKYS